jgi:hypothetical protein
MRIATHTHLSVIDGLARFARVTVIASAEIVGWGEPVLILNDRGIDKRSEADDRFVEAAVQAVRDTESRLGWQGLPLRVDKVESSNVDMCPEAARLAAISAATELIGGQPKLGLP